MNRRRYSDREFRKLLNDVETGLTTLNLNALMENWPVSEIQLSQLVEKLVGCLDIAPEAVPRQDRWTHPQLFASVTLAGFTQLLDERHAAVGAKRDRLTATIRRIFLPNTTQILSWQRNTFLLAIDPQVLVVLNFYDRLAGMEEDLMIALCQCPAALDSLAIALSVPYTTVASSASDSDEYFQSSLLLLCQILEFPDSWAILLDRVRFRHSTRPFISNLLAHWDWVQRIIPVSPTRSQDDIETVLDQYRCVSSLCQDLILRSSMYRSLFVDGGFSKRLAGVSSLLRSRYRGNYLVDSTVGVEVAALLRSALMSRDIPFILRLLDQNIMPHIVNGFNITRKARGDDNTAISVSLLDLGSMLSSSRVCQSATAAVAPFCLTLEDLQKKGAWASLNASIVMYDEVFNQQPLSILMCQNLHHFSSDTRLIPKARKCSQCEAVMYCCRKCQKEDWNTHRFECRRLSPVTQAMREEKVWIPTAARQRNLSMAKASFELLQNTHQPDTHPLPQDLKVLVHPPRGKDGWQDSTTLMHTFEHRFQAPEIMSIPDLEDRLSKLRLWSKPRFDRLVTCVLGRKDFRLIIFAFAYGELKMYLTCIAHTPFPLHPDPTFHFPQVIACPMVQFQV